MRFNLSQNNKYLNAKFHVTCVVIPSPNYKGRLYVKNNSEYNTDFKILTHLFDSLVLDISISDDKIQIVDGQESNKYIDAIINGDEDKIKKDRTGNLLTASLLQRKENYKIDRSDNPLLRLGADFVEIVKNTDAILFYNNARFQVNPARWGEYRRSNF